MEHELQITFRGLDATEAIKASIQEKTRKLERYYDKIESCRVVIESPSHHQQKGGMYHVKVRLGVPGDEIVVSREPGMNDGHQDPYIAINDAFKEVKRRLEGYVSRRRRQVKKHEEAPRGHIVRIFRSEGYGFIETEEGREIYFHKNSVLNGGFHELAVGTPVRFAEEVGEKGPQASTVSVLGSIGS